MLFLLAKNVNRSLFPAACRTILRVWLVGAFLLLLFCACHMNHKTLNSSEGPTGANRPSTDPLAIHHAAIAIDMHADTPQRLVDEEIDLARQLDDGHFDSPRAREGGLDAQFFSIWVEPQLFGGGGAGAVKRADALIASVQRLVERNPETWAMATSAAEIRSNAAAGKLSALLGLEGGYAIDERIENVERYYQAGVRYMSPAWSVSTSWAGSSGDEVGRTRGLNEFGKTVVREMNRLGMMIDVSHVSDQTFWDIIASSSKPIIATHSGCRAIANVPRNLDDEMIRALAKTGGVVSVLFYPEFIEPGWSEKKKQVDAEIAPLVQRASDAEKGNAAQKKMARDRVRREEYARRLPAVGVARLVDHIDHIVGLVGVDHVGVGSDFDGVSATLSDLRTIADLPNLTRELVRRGYSAADIEKILGGNILRVMTAVEQR